MRQPFNSQSAVGRGNSLSRRLPSYSRLRGGLRRQRIQRKEMRSPPTQRNGHFFRNQDFERLKREFRRSGSLFVDPEFPPTNVSLFLDTDRSADIVWKRPSDLVDDPQLFVEGASPNDVTQGILGNCWFVSACSALTHNEELLKKVIPNALQQEYNANYCGIFEFCFWRFGEWIHVVIDDLLPTRDGKLLFARSKTPNEFWSALLEKAFAKLYGCYENLVGGQLADALQDVSGGVAETINVSKYLAEDPHHTLGDLFQTLRIAFEQQALIVAAIAARNKDEVEKSLDCGLVVGHAYAVRVTAVRFIELDAQSKSESQNQLIRTHSKKLFPTTLRKMMIRLQNPWGEREWNGPWSDGSAEWELVTEKQKLELGITVDEDGEFWMSWDEFMRYFTDISVCQLFNTSASVRDPTLPRPPTYSEFIAFDCWTTNGVKIGAPADRSGGCQNFPATFCFNPQYRFDVESTGAEVMLALTQRETPPEAGKQREPFITIGLHVMRVECNRRYRIHQPINPIATSDYVGTRSIYLHLRGLAAGRYIVMPTTYAPREQADFMLRIYSPDQMKPKLLKSDQPIQKFPVFHCSRLRAVTRVHVLEAYSDDFRLKHLSVAVVYEGKRVRSPLFYAEDYAVAFDEMFLFHSASLQHKFLVEVWYSTSSGGLKVCARANVIMQTDNDTVRQEIKLHGVGSQSTFDDGFFDDQSTDSFESRPSRHYKTQRDQFEDAPGFDQQYTYKSVCMVDGQPIVLDKFDCHNQVAVGRFKNAINRTGWSYLEIETFAGYDEDLQAYSAGILSQTVIEYHLQNTYYTYCDGFKTYCKQLGSYLRKNFDYIKRKVESAPKDDAYWAAVRRAFHQITGVWDGFTNSTFDPRISYQVTPIYLININGELYDLEKKFNKTKDPLNEEAGEKCSGLVKVAPNNSDIFFSQVTMSGFQNLLRVLKLYKFGYEKHLFPGHTNSFSSYPGMLYSSDDFALTSAGLAVLETTISALNNSIFEKIKPDGQLHTWIRAIVANQMARSGREWCSIFGRKNSGTYNNQWVVLDYKRFTPNKPLIDYGLLYVLEQLPGKIVYADQTSYLKEHSYYASYNLPFYHEISQLSGFEQKGKDFYWFSWYNCPRANIFRRDHSKVFDLDSMTTLMRYNDYQHELFSRSISARGDLNDPNGSYPFRGMGYSNHGALDAKITNYEMFQELRFRAIGSPSYENVPAFQWSKSSLEKTVKHVGHPDVWKFAAVETKWETPDVRVEL
ncbi:Calpain-5 [Aphelenchoides besseyi]|nr:Calpain-5 [Aphelenchoides besseyi]